MEFTVLPKIVIAFIVALVCAWLYQFLMDITKRYAYDTCMYPDSSAGALLAPDDENQKHNPLLYLPYKQYDFEYDMGTALCPDQGDVLIAEVCLAFFVCCLGAAGSLAIAATWWCDGTFFGVIPAPLHGYGCQHIGGMLETAHDTAHAMDDGAVDFVNRTIKSGFDGMESKVGDFAHFAGFENLVHTDQLKSENKVITEKPDHVVEELTRTVLPTVRQGATAMVPVGVAYIASMFGSQKDSEFSKLACAAVTFYVHTKISNFASNPMPYLNRMQAFLQTIIPRIDTSLSEDWTTVEM